MTAGHEHVLIVDFGSQTTQLIARRVREAHVYCEITPPTLTAAKIRERKPIGIILSGGPASVYDQGAPTLDPAVLDLGIPILGICYGAQWIAHTLGGAVERAKAREFGNAELEVVSKETLLDRFDEGERTVVWMSHGDHISTLPEGFNSVARSANTKNAAIAHPRRNLYGVQFHPEVTHSVRGRDIINGFVLDVCKAKAEWTPESFVHEAIERIKQQVPAPHRAICGLSGGVDSAVAAMLCHRALGDRLHCIFVDNGLLRLGEVEEVSSAFHGFGLNLRVVDAKERFMKALAGVSDPERKRKIIGHEFIQVFEEEARKVDGATSLVQGTLYPDVIESVSVHGPSAVIKSHHNVGGLPEKMNLSLVEPLRELFKDEVRQAGLSLGMPRPLLYRQPFPGPGLAIRCLGDLNEERLTTLREADAIVREEIAAHPIADSIWQSFAVLLPIRSVGVMGDFRTYEETCVIRAVTSTDGMTADWAELPYPLLAKMSTRIINEVKGINRVTYDISSKPPSTIEWE